MESDAFPQLHEILSSYMKTHFAAFLPVALGNWEILVTVLGRPASRQSCRALALISFTDRGSRAQYVRFPLSATEAVRQREN